MWAHEKKASDGTRLGIQESLRWTEVGERLAETALTMPDTRLVYPIFLSCNDIISL